MRKQEFIALAEELLNEPDLSSRQEDLKLLRREYKYLTSREDETFFDKEETDKLIAVYKELTIKAPSLLISPADEKKAIIEKAKKLLDEKNLIAASKEMDSLSLEFKAVGRAGSKEEDDELWADFKSIKDEFYSKKREYFEELDKSNAVKRAQKEEIIEEAKEVVSSFENVKDANAKMDELRKKWKAVGYSGKGDDLLWKEFIKVLDEFQEKKKEHHQEMIKIFEERANKKEELIKKAKIILANSEFSDEEIQKVKSLRGEYKAIGFAGKEKEEDLYQRFNEVIQKYFEEMKFYKN